MVELVLPSISQTEQIIAWRSWYAVAKKDSFFLNSYFEINEWPRGRRFEASCAVSYVPHEAPSADCSCGIYALKSEDEMFKYIQEVNWHGESAGPITLYENRWLCYVIGKVSLWGEVIEGDKGYRAQYAYPYDLQVLNKNEYIAKSLREQYQVDVRMRELA